MRWLCGPTWARQHFQPVSLREREEFKTRKTVEGRGKTLFTNHSEVTKTDRALDTKGQRKKGKREEPLTTGLEG